MENLNAEQVMSELDNEIKFAKFTNVSRVLISVKCAQFVLDHVQYYEQRIGELAEQLDAMRGEAEAWKEHSKTLEGENEKLKALVDEGFDTENSLNGKIKELTEEVAEEKAKDEMCAEVIKRQDKEIAQKDAKIKRLRADTVREILAKVKERAYYDTTETGITHMVIGTDDIDEIAKEMLECKDER